MTVYSVFVPACKKTQTFAIFYTSFKVHNLLLILNFRLVVFTHLQVTMKLINRFITIFICIALFANAAKGQNADFTVNTQQGCAPLHVQFNCHPSVTGTQYSHKWELGSITNTSVLPSPSKIFSSPGTYTIKHTVTGPNGTNTITKTNFITVWASPTVDFSASPLSGCPPLKVTFTDNSTLGEPGNASYTWYFGGPPIYGNPATYTFTNSGKYDVTLEVTNGKKCTAFLKKKQYISVDTKPDADFSADKTNLCVPGGTVQFSDTVYSGGNYSYYWDFGDNNTSTQRNPSHTYTGTPGQTFTVMLVVTGQNGCTDTVEKYAYIKVHEPKASFTVANSACLGTDLQLNNTSTPPGGSSWWNFDGIGTSTIGSPSFVFPSPGVKNITLVYSIGGCHDTVSKQVTIRPKPYVDFYKVPDTLCPAPQTVQFFSTGTAQIYEWDFGDVVNNTSNQKNPSHTYNSNGWYTVTLRVTDAFGCKDTIVKEQYVELYDLIAAIDKIEPDSGCAPLYVSFKSAVGTQGGPYPYPVKYKWYFGDGDSSSTANPSHIYTDTGVYTVVLKVTSPGGNAHCFKTDTATVLVGNKPTADFTGTPLDICADDTVYFTNKSKNARGVRWIFGDGGVSIAWDANHRYQIPDTYTVKLIAYDRGCTDTMTREDYVLVRPTKALIGRTYSCDTALRVNFKNESIGDSSHIWYFGDGDTSTAEDPIHVYASYGTYKAFLVAFNPTTGCDDTDWVEIKLINPVRTLTADKTAICAGDTVTFTANLTGGAQSPYYFTWFVNGVFVEDTVAVYKRVFEDAGLYTIKVWSLDERPCLDSVVKHDWIFVSKPDAGFVTDSSIGCLGLKVGFTDTSKAVPSGVINSRLWNFGSSASDTARRSNDTVSKVYNDKGLYNVTLIVTDGFGCKDTVERPAAINISKPEAGFYALSPVCVGADLTFTDTSKNAAKWFWDFDDGNTSTDTTPIHKYMSRGTFDPVQIVTDSVGCTDTFTFKSVTAQKPYAIIDASDSVSICPLPVTFIDSSKNAKNRFWYFDNGNGPSSLIKSTYVFTDPKIYNVMLVAVDAQGCKDTAYKPIKILGYGGAFSYTPKDGCAPLSVDFSTDIKGSIASMIWDFGDGYTQTSSQSKFTYTYKTPGKYVPKIVFNDGLGCSATSEGSDTVYVDAAIADFDPGPACQYSTVEFQNNSYGVISPIKSYFWEYHDGGFSAVKDAKKTYGPPGKYKVMLAVENDRGCKDTLIKDITIHVPIEMNVGNDTVICLGDAAHLQPTGGVTYQWSPATGLSCTNCTDPQAGPNVKTTYVVISTDVNGCHDTDNIVIDIKTKAEATPGPGGEMCDDESIQLYVEGGQKFLWSPAAGLSSTTIRDPMASPDQTTSYKIVTYEGSCIPDTDYVKVEVHPKPVVKVRGETTIVAGNTADLLASGDNISRFLWTPDYRLSCTNCADPVASPYKTTTYRVTVYSDFNCQDSADVKITVLCDESQVFIPNTFTPNGDGQNDVFYVRGTGIRGIRSIRVYNRWGEVVFERTNVPLNDKTAGWDGTYNGSTLAPDVYVYVVEAFCENDELMRWKGDVTIIR